MLFFIRNLASCIERVYPEEKETHTAHIFLFKKKSSALHAKLVTCYAKKKVKIHILCKKKLYKKLFYHIRFYFLFLCVKCNVRETPCRMCGATVAAIRGGRRGNGDSVTGLGLSTSPGIVTLSWWEGSSLVCLGTCPGTSRPLRAILYGKGY